MEMTAKTLARPAGIEPATLGLEGRHSVNKTRTVNQLQDRTTFQDASTVVLVVDPATLTPEQLETLRANGAMYVTIRGRAQ
jgi:hypothetical protein